MVAPGSDQDAHRIASVMLLARIWSALAAPAQLAATAYFLSPHEQGYAYTFVSLLALSSMFELGLGQVLVNTVCHHARGCSVGSAGIHGPPQSTHTVLVLAGSALRWCTGAALLFAVALHVFGGHLLSRPGAEIAWEMPWSVALASTAVAMALGPVYATLEGLGDLRALTWLRFCSAAAASVVVVCCLAAGLGLWAGVLGVVANVVIQAGWLLRQRHGFLFGLARERPDGGLWRKEIWPLQWRFALSWMGGYMIFQAIVPLSFASLGPEVAGRVGMSMAIGWSVIGVSSIWVNASLPDFARWASLGNHAALRTRLAWGLRRGLLVGCGLSCAGVFVTALTQNRGLPLVDRVLDWPWFALILATAMSHTLQSALAAALRSYRREPMLVLVLAETLVLATGMPFALHFGRMDITLSLYGAIHGLGGLAGTLLIYRYWSRANGIA